MSQTSFKGNRKPLNLPKTKLGQEDKKRKKGGREGKGRKRERRQGSKVVRGGGEVEEREEGEERRKTFLREYLPYISIFIHLSNQQTSNFKQP